MQEVISNERQDAQLVHSTRVSFITVEIREVLPGLVWHIYTVTAKAETYVESAVSLDEAYCLYDQAIADITQRIITKRKGRPTPYQLATLFSLKIPIRLDLTWGEASDSIDAALTEKRNEKLTKAHLINVIRKRAM